MGGERNEKVAERVSLASGALTNAGSHRGIALNSWRQVVATLATICLAGLATPASVAAQQPERCRILCAPELKIEPTITIENLFRPPRIETLEDGLVVQQGRLGRESVFELIFALDVPTQIPRIGLTLEAILVPFGETDTNPFTGAPASSLPGGSIRDNGIELELELNISLFDTDHTGGWVSSHFDIVDKFSPAEEPRATSVYTHKLNFELDTAFNVFNRLPERNWLRNVEVEVSLDYVATGLPKAGDLLGSERFVDEASPWSVSFVFVFPLAPLVP